MMMEMRRFRIEKPVEGDCLRFLDHSSTLHIYFPLIFVAQNECTRACSNVCAVVVVVVVVMGE